MATRLAKEALVKGLLLVYSEPEDGQEPYNEPVGPSIDYDIIAEYTVITELPSSVTAHRSDGTNATAGKQRGLQP